jgi:hypothetical protein
MNLTKRVAMLEAVLAKIVVAARVPCSELGQTWTDYEEGAGKFILALTPARRTDCHPTRWATRAAKKSIS